MKQPFAIIIGAGPGISMGIAHRFGREGFRIGLLGRNANKLELLCKELTDHSIHVDFRVADVRSKEQLNDALDSLKNAYGVPDLVVFNPSAIVVKDVLELDWSTLLDCFEICTGGAFHTAQNILPEMLRNNHGKLFFTGGGTALQGDPRWTSLSVGKAGMRNLVQALVKRAEATDVHVAQVTVCGQVQASDSKYNPNSISELYWKLYNQTPGSFEHEIVY